MLLSNAISRVPRPAQKTNKGTTQCSPRDQIQVQPMKDNDIRLLQTLLRTGNFRQVQYASTVPSGPQISCQQEVSALTISKKPQFFKVGVCRSGSISSYAPLPGQIYKSQMLGNPLVEQDAERLCTPEIENSTLDAGEGQSSPEKAAKAAEIASYMAVLASNKYKVSEYTKMHSSW